MVINKKQLPESDLVHDIQLGDRFAFRELYKRFYKKLYFIALRYLKHREMAEDAVQDVFVNLWIKKETLNVTISLNAFMATCLKNHVLNVIRSNKKKIANTFELSEEHHPVSEYTSDDIQMREYKKIMHTGINNMPDQKKRVFEMKVFLGESNSVVAAKLGISINTVKVHYYHSRRFMKAYLKKEAGLDAVL